jgi:tetratricopeptide (TPR) repeat protein
MAAFTPTPASTLTVTPSPNPAATLMPTAMLTEPPLPTLNPAEDPAYLYDQAATSMRLARYEDAIAWLDALQALAPDYRAAETQAMLMDALTEQGKIYLRGQNKDGEDRLARGVLLIYRADDIGDVEPSTLLGEAIFAELYLNARNYVNGGYYDNAISILEDLCRQNCLWGYPGWDPVTVQDLLDQARAGASQ